MESIDYYIEQSKHMANTSDGGSAAYHFEDAVLVKYTNYSKYGIARENEETIMQTANEKRRNGVNTPYHFEMKREVIGEENICWVLQEKAKGISFANYNSRYVDKKTLFERQEELLNAPLCHYEKCISDLCELFNMGLEPKDKNIYYDKKEGFTFIDLLCDNGTPLDNNSIKDIFMLLKYSQFIYNVPMISSYDQSTTEEEYKKSLAFSYAIRLKLFLAMKNVIPKFERFERWILRSYSKDLLDYFISQGFRVGDLSLTDTEYEEFSVMIEKIITESLEKIASGKYDFWQIGANEIRISLDMMGLNYSWIYHKLNTRVREDFDSDYSYYRTCTKDLETFVNNMFNSRLEILASHTDNPNILRAKEELDKKMLSKR